MPKQPLRKRALPAKRPLWDWTQGITQSALDRFNSCREQFSLGYIEGMTSKGFSVALEFGTMIHIAIQQHGDPACKSSPQEIIDGVCASYHDSRVGQLSKLDIATMSKTIAAAEAVFPLYCQTVGEDDKKQRFIAHEQYFEVPHQFPVGKGLSHSTINLRGVRDGAYRTGKADYLGLFETKTKSNIDDNAIISGLRADLQTMFYLHSMRLSYNETPKEVLYNVIRRPGQKFLDRDTYATFKQRIIDDIKKRPTHYTRRYEVNVLQSDLDTFRDKVLDPSLRVMLHWWESVKDHPFDRFKSPYHFVNLNALYTKYGPCQLYGLMVLGKRRDYYARSFPFPELENDPSYKAAMALKKAS